MMALACRWMCAAMVAGLVQAAVPASGASRVLPGLRFRVLSTPHFRVYYHQGGEQLARRLAGIAESVRSTIPDRLGLPAPDITHVVLVDQDDAANGWATPLPYDTVFVTAAWPAPSEIIGNTNDWLRLVFTHEFVHVLQLRQSRGWAARVRLVFGRAPLAFPNLFLPRWQVEGLATFEESRETGAGRLRAGDSSALVRQRVREAGGERLDHVSGGQVAWPGGVGPYLQGGFFNEYLATRFGEAALGELVRRTAGRLPYLASPAFRATFGASLGELWSDFQATLAAGADPGAREAARGRRVTYNGHYVWSPRFTDGGRGLVYSVRGPHDLPSVDYLPMADSDRPGAADAMSGAGGRPVAERLVTRFGGEQLSVRGPIAYYDQSDYEANVAWRSDLYAMDLKSRRVQRLTNGARLLAPDVSPDGRTLVCVKVGDGVRHLVRFRISGDRVGHLALSEDPWLAAADPEATYGSPRWSPDGSMIAAERQLRGGPSAVVAVDASTGAVRVLADTDKGRLLTPTWLPDGRSLLFVTDRDGGSFQIRSIQLETPEVRRILQVPGGALAPEVSPDGRRLVYVGYTGAGYDLFEAPLGSPSSLPAVHQPEPAGSVDAPDVAVTSEAPVAPDSGGGAGVPTDAAPYRALSTLLPRAWYPVGDLVDGRLRLGAGATGVDLLGRHLFNVRTLWQVRDGADATGGSHRERPDWDAYYVYNRWRPAFFVAGSSERSFVRQHAGGVRVADAELRESDAAIGVSLPFLRLRQSHVLQSSFVAQHDTLSAAGGERRYRRNAIRTAWAFNSTHMVGYSVSPERGVALSVTSEQVRAALGADGDADAFTMETRWYHRLGGRHSVLAARVAAGASFGDAGVARVFYLGGPRPAGPLIDFGSDALGMLRGYQDQSLTGRRLAAANVEYRFPIWRIERGRGTWPLFLRTLHGAVFVDTGAAWQDRFAWSRLKTSFGAELSLDSVLGFGLPVTVSAGIAHAPVRGPGDRTTTYVRVGRAF